MTTVSKDGTLYGIIWTSGKPSVEGLGLMGWNVELRTTEKGRKLTLRSLCNGHSEIIYTFEIHLRDLLKLSKAASPYIRDVAHRRTELDRLDNLRLVQRNRKKAE